MTEKEYYKKYPKGYIYRYKPILFNGKGSVVPQRVNNELDKFDLFFNSKEEFQVWYDDLVIGLAQLDECMNYNKFFIREKGNIGVYERDEKRFYPVDGRWCAISYDYSDDFKKFLKENNWLDNSFGLMDRYQKAILPYGNIIPKRLYEI